MINMGEIFAHERIGGIKMDRVPLSSEEIDRYSVIKGDLLFARQSLVAAGAGKCSIIKEVSETTTFESHLIRVRLDELTCNSSFYFYYFLSPQGNANVQSLVMQVAAAGIRGSELAKLHVPVPPLRIQHRIADILSAYDELIDNNQRRIKILELMARTIYREWFVHFRFPGHESVPSVLSERGHIPKGWKATTLGDLIELRKGKSITKDSVREGKIPVVAGGMAPAYFHDTPNTHGPVITISASGANAGFVNLYFMDVWASDCTFVDSNTTPHVLYYYLWFDHHRAAITRLQRGSAQPHVYPKDLATLEALDIPEAHLVAFRLQVEPLFNLMLRLTNTGENLRRTRDLLLPRLLSGELDVEASAA